MPEADVISTLMRISAKLVGRSLRTALETCTWERLQNDITTYLPLLIHKGNANIKPEDDTGSLSIILDLAAWEQFGDPVASGTTTKQINERLVADMHPAVITNRYDAFGASYSDMGETMPSVRLTPGFEVVLRSMFREQVCQYRYGNADDASFPISRVNRAAAKTALEWIVRPDKENVTWLKIDKDAMLFVYPDKLPQVLPKFAGLFGGGNADKDSKAKNESRFEALAEQFITAFNKIKPQDRPENIRIFALQQIPPALSKRAKVIFTRNLSADGLIHSITEWRCGCSNLPDKAQVGPDIPFPLDTSKIVNKVWKQDGTRADGKNAVKHLHYYQGMELLLDEPQESFLLRVLHAVTTHSLGLVLFVADNLPRCKKAAKDIHKENMLKEEIGRLCPLLGLLLYKSDIKKECYMHDVAYLLGQVLKISDALHELYCEIKREGDVPPQLVGNSVFVAASETPVRSLALLGTRMMPYLAWARQYRSQKKDKSDLVGWFLSRYEVITPQLHLKLTENVRFGDLEKAQLFIGYLAELPKSDKQKNAKQEDTQDDD
jgi:hypothetical protein